MVKPLLLTGSLAIALLLPSAANAGSLHVAAGETVVLGGRHVYDSVTIDGKVLVAKYDGSQGGGLSLHAITMTIGPEGVIDASGSGYRGGKGPAGGGEGYGEGGTMPTGAGETPAATPAPAPGGGGAHIGAGGAGYRSNTPYCGMLATAGTPYGVTPPMLLPFGMEAFGSAGGSGQLAPENSGMLRAGGNGGGYLVIEAATLVLNGTLRANGLEATALLGTVPGAGAGGTVWVRAAALTLGRNARIQARGGNATSIGSGLIGGAGGGGLVVVMSPLDQQTVANTVDVSGGDGAGCASAALDGSRHIQLVSGAFDLDDDGFAGYCADAGGGGGAGSGGGGGAGGGEACTVTDCDDSDSHAYPDAPERCNGRDDNCDGDADEASAASLLCAKGSGLQCVEGNCVLPADGGGDPPSTNIAFRGGLCAYQPTNHRQRQSLWLLGVAAAWLFRRRQRKPSRSDQ